MKYILIVLLVVVSALGMVWVAYPDDTLAYADHRLIDVSRLSGNPSFLLQLRNQIHGYRYAHTLAATPLNTRIVRAPSPKQIVPPPTAVVDPRMYQQGSFPSKMYRPGVLGPGEPIPGPQIATGVPFTFAEDFEGSNVNPNYALGTSTIGVQATAEGKFAGNVNHDYALGWNGYTVWGQPTADGEFQCIHGGHWSQKISGEATWRGGIFRQFRTSPNSVFSLKVFGHLYILGGGAIQVGYDPTGGTNASATTVIWLTQMSNLGQWTELTGNGQATGPITTVFLEGYSIYDDNTNVYFDDFQMSGFAPA
jgi:hypothetical protein